MSFIRAIAPLIDFAYPPRCPSCGAGVLGGLPGAGVLGGLPGAGEALCGTCWAALDIPGQPACRSCQLPLAPEALTPDLTCAACVAEPPLHAGIAAATLYGDISRDLVLKLKHAGKIALAGPMGQLMAARLASGGVAVAGDPLLIPVPLHPTRLWSRGYNQSVLLASSMAAVKGWSVLPDALRRTRRTRALGGLNTQERRAMLDGAIAALRPERVAGRNIVLVDDVVTSGATTDSCIRALKAAGARQVIVACYARVARPKASERPVD